MKRKILSCALLVAFMLSLSLSAAAATPRWNNVRTAKPGLSFSGSTATCTLRVDAFKGDAKINASLTLSGGSTNQTWSNLTGTGSLSLSRTLSGCKSGTTYRLSVTATVTDSTGTETVSTSVDARCP